MYQGFSLFQGEHLQHEWLLTGTDDNDNEHTEHWEQKISHASVPHFSPQTLCLCHQTPNHAGFVAKCCFFYENQQILSECFSSSLFNMHNTQRMLYSSTILQPPTTDEMSVFSTAIMEKVYSSSSRWLIITSYKSTTTSVRKSAIVTGER